MGGGALEGLADAFFAAGARAVLASHWEVPSVATQKLMTGVFARYAKDPSRDLAEALRQSQLALIAQPATAHPFNWAAFTLIGDSGTATRTTGGIRRTRHSGKWRMTMANRQVLGFCALAALLLAGVAAQRRESHRSRGARHRHQTGHERRLDQAADAQTGSARHADLADRCDADDRRPLRQAAVGGRAGQERQRQRLRD